MIRRRVRSSRLTRTSERQNKKQALLFTLGIVVVIGILIQFGPLLVNLFGNAVYSLRGEQSEEEVIDDNTLVQAPVLTDIPTATQSSRITFSGIAPSDKGTIELYVNDQLEDELELSSTSFEVKNVALRKGKNVIKARYSEGKNTSPFSEEHEVTYITEKPKLEVSHPSDGASFTKADKNIQITGQTDPDNTITVNSFRAIVNADGEFSYLLPLNDGENQITVITQNPAGITSEKKLKVTYTP